MVKNNIELYEKAITRAKSRSTGGFMSIKLDRIKGLSADDILYNTGQLDAVPVDLDSIIHFLGVHKISGTFEDIEKIEGKGHISGLVLLNGDEVGVFYNKDDRLDQKRFTIAHELGHCCLHGDSLENGYVELLHKNGFENEHEKEASVFASKLLIPEISLRRVLDKLLLPTLTGLSDIFQVPQHIMEHRLKELEIEYYSDNKGRMVNT